MTTTQLGGVCWLGYLFGDLKQDAHLPTAPPPVRIRPGRPGRSEENSSQPVNKLVGLFIREEQQPNGQTLRLTSAALAQVPFPVVAELQKQMQPEAELRLQVS